MLVFPEILRRETHVVQLFPTAQALNHWRVGWVTCATKPTSNSGPPYAIVLAYADTREHFGIRQAYRIAYISCAGAPNYLDGLQAEPANQASHNLITPQSFRAGEVGEQPTAYEILRADFRIEWTNRLTDYKSRWDAYYQRLGLPVPCNSSFEPWVSDPIF